jgi:hypothetical protein
MRSPGGLKPNDALWDTAEKISDLVSFQSLSKNGLPAFIRAMYLENVLRRVETDHFRLQW